MRDRKITLASRIVGVPEIAYFAISDAHLFNVRNSFETVGTFGKTVVLEKDKAWVACRALISLVLAVRTSRLALYTDEVISDRDVKLCGPGWARF